MRAEGVTDYIALPLVVYRWLDSGIELDHEAAGRFTSQQLNGLRSLVRALAR